MEMMIRKRGGLVVVAFVMACIVFAVISVTTIASNNNVPSDSIVASLRGGRERRSLIHTTTDTSTNTDKDSYYFKPKSIISSSTRKLEDEQQDEDDNGDNDDEQQEDNDSDDQGDEEEEQEEEEEQQDDKDQNENEDNNDDASNSNGSMEYIDNLVADLRDRFESDVATMWNTSPGEWDEEIWKDFGIVAGIVVGLLAFLCLCCCCCCRSGNDGKDLNALTQEEADARRKKKRGHRGRFFHRNRSEDTDCSRSEHTDWSSPFVLIEDVEKDDTFKTQGSKSTTAIGGIATSPVYTRGGASADVEADGYATLSPLSSNSKAEMQSPGNTSGAPSVPNLNDDASGANGKTLKKNSSVLQESSGGIVGETLDVWSEFLGFKKTKYNIKADEIDEDSAIEETDDERERRGAPPRGRSTRSSRAKSSSKKEIVLANNSDETNTSKKLMGSVGGSVHTGNNSLMPSTAANVNTATAAAAPIAITVSTTGTAGAESFGGEAADTPLPATSTTSSIHKMTAETPIISNTKPSVKSPRQASRKNFLKTKNLLRSFGSGNKSKTYDNNKEQYSKEESLLGEDGKSGEDI